MTQVEIAKKILEQGNCHGMKCSDIGCPMLSKVNQVCMADYPVTMSDSLYKVKQWLKEQEKEMIDLTKNQIVDPPVKCWTRCFNEQWEEEYLYSIDHRINFPFGGHVNEYKQCTLTDPTKPKFKPWLTIEDVPDKLWGKALVKSKNSDFRHYMPFVPFHVITFENKVIKDLVYLPLDQPLDSDWLEFGEWV